MFKLSRDEIQEGKADSIRRAIEQAILEERLRPGEVLPTVRTLATNLGINKNTVAVAYRQLQQSGLIIAGGRRGSIVAGQASANQKRQHGQGVATQSVRDGNPDIAFLPDETDVRDALGRMSVDHHLYGDQRNDGTFLQWARQCFEADDIEVTGGIFVSAGALDLVERTLNAAELMPGDKVAIEDPGYMTTLGLVRAMGFEPVPLRLDQHGIVPESLAAALKRGARAVLASSRAQNPTGVATSRARAAELKRIVAGTSNVLFVDDDHSSLLKLAPYHPWHMAGGRWLTVRSMSKFLGPDYRIAISTGDADTIGRLEFRQSVGMGWVSTFLQRLVYGLLESATVQRKIAAAGVAYRERYELLSGALKKRGFSVIGSAGLNLWVPIANEREVAERLFDAGWLVKSGRDFCVTESSGIRVTSSRMTPQQSLAFLDALVMVQRATAVTLAA